MVRYDIKQCDVVSEVRIKLHLNASHNGNDELVLIAYCVTETTELIETIEHTTSDGFGCALLSL